MQRPVSTRAPLDPTSGDLAAHPSPLSKVLLIIMGQLQARDGTPIRVTSSLPPCV